MEIDRNNEYKPLPCRVCGTPVGTYGHKYCSFGCAHEDLLLKHSLRTINSWSELETTIRRIYPDPQPCIECGKPGTKRHHPDYDKPLEIVWLCAKCHTRAHSRIIRPEHPAGDQNWTQLQWTLRKMYPTPQPCAKCGEPGKHRHHPSYAPDKLLDIVWLCRKCHSQEHLCVNLRPDNFSTLYLAGDRQISETEYKRLTAPPPSSPEAFLLAIDNIKRHRKRY